MIALAFSMGLLGSLHCIGMCGPFALIFGGGSEENRTKALWRGIQYNSGRLVSYAILGILFGFIGNLIFFAGLQQIITLLTGIFLLVLFLFSLNLDLLVNRTKVGTYVYKLVSKQMSKIIAEKDRYPALAYGIVNGFLPCGMVYLAIAGAITEGSVLNAVLFMLAFGLGTFPMMMILSSGSHFLSPRMKRGFQKIIPLVSLVFGIFLIYRGFNIAPPEQLNFSFLINNPVMCH